MDTIKPLFTATATATGGRNGHTQASDGSVSADLSVPKAMGGPGKPGTTTPEHLFAAGYAACFGGALDFVGKQHKKDATKARITADVSIGPRDGGGFGLAVKLRVEDSTLPQAELAALAKEAHEKICPYRTPRAEKWKSVLRKDHALPKVRAPIDSIEAIADASLKRIQRGKCASRFRSVSRRRCLPEASARALTSSGAARLLLPFLPSAICARA
jgi:Ohr subfamily peroxiredoxin